MIVSIFCACPHVAAVASAFLVVLNCGKQRENNACRSNGMEICSGLFDP